MSQQHQNTVRVASIDDLTLLEFFHRAAMAMPASHMNVHAGHHHLGQFNNLDAFSEKFPRDSWRGTRIISNAAVSLFGGNVTIHFQRWVTQFGNPDVRVPSDWECEFWLQRNNSSPEQVVTAMRYLDGLREQFVATPTAGSDDVRDVVKRQLAELTSLHTKIVSDAEEARRTAEREFDVRRTRLEEEWETRRRALEADADTKRAKIVEGEELLRKREKEIDDRGHMHARRELRGDITKSLKERLERPGVSFQAGFLRLGFVALNVAAIVAFGGAAWLGSASFPTATVDAWSLAAFALRVSLPTAGAVALLFYLLNWLRRVHADDVRSERDLERYRYDIDRASWAVETILEAQGKEGGEVPQAWIDGVTSNMFSRTDGRADDNDALDALAALIGHSAKAEIGTNGAKLEINRNGLRQIGRISPGQD